MNKPKIRFKGFEGEWKEKALGDVVDEFKYGINAAAVSYDGENKYLRITDIDEGSRAFIKDVLASPDADLSSCNEYIMQDGDIVIARTGASVGKSYIYHPIDGKVYFAGFLIRARVNKNVDREFVFQNTLTDGFKKYIRFVSQRSGQPGVNAEELKSYLMNLPASLPEQRALASYFTSLDAQIAASTSRLSSLKQIKAASLLNMFPQKGEMVPRVRFKGFEGEWKERKLGEVFSERVENNINGQLLSVTLNKGIIRASENGKLDNSNSDKSKYKVVNINDIAYNSMRMWQGASGCSKYEGIVSPAYTVITPKEDIDSSFFSYLFKTDIAINKFRLHSQGLTSDNWNLKYPAFSKIDVYCPLDISEQRAIASYFTALDAQITLHRERLEKLKQIKAACLERMFA